MNLNITPAEHVIYQERRAFMIERIIAAKIEKSISQVPVVTVLGPRQAGKTTLVRVLFPDYTYVSR